MEPFVRLGDFIDEHTPGHHGPLSPRQVAVERHHDRRIAGPIENEIESRHPGRLVDDAMVDANTALDFHVTRHGHAQASGRRMRQPEVEKLLGRGGLQRGHHVENKRMPALSLDEQRELAVRAATDRSSLAIERGTPQPNAGKIERKSVEAVFEDVDRERAGDLGPLVPDRGLVIGRHDCRRQRRMGLRGLLGLLEKVFIFLATEQGPLRLVFQQDVQVAEGDVDLAHQGARLVGADRREGRGQQRHRNRRRCAAERPERPRMS